MKTTNLLAFALLTAVVACSGCKTMEFAGTNWINQKERPRLRVELPFQGKKKDSFSPPQKMTVIWKESTLATAGNPTVRGFGGRVFFYDAENQAVKVDGEMIVYGFDTASGSTQADKKFVFKSDKLDDHYGETDLGHSYSFWVPWDKTGGDQKSITLIPAFKTVEGKLVKGSQSANMLPGRVPEQPELKSSTYMGKEVELTSGNDSGKVIQAGHSESKSSVRETTIRLPKHLGNRISSIPDGPLNEIKITRKSINVLNQKGEVVAGQDFLNRSQSPRNTESESSEMRERAPFGKPNAFN